MDSMFNILLSIADLFAVISLVCADMSDVMKKGRDEWYWSSVEFPAGISIPILSFGNRPVVHNSSFLATAFQNVFE